MSILLHVTPRRNLRSIWQHGISPLFALGARAECWFCSPRLRQWAIEHVAERHGVPASEVAVLRVSIPRPHLIRRKAGVWTCSRPVRSVVSVSVPFAA